MTPHTAIDVRGLHREYTTRNATVKALHDVTFATEGNVFVAVVGPSGCGKSSLLRLLSGLDRPTSGTITLRNGSAAPPRVAMVFQEPALMPWLSVLDNVMLPLRALDLDPDVRMERCEELLARVGLKGAEGVLAGTLSQGMKQRASLARALASRPDILLMDEPFASLDYQNRRYHQELLQELWSGTRLTVVFVTHDIQEAVVLADEIIVLSAGPGRIKTTFQVPFPRPRSPSALALDPDAGRLVASISELIDIEPERSNGVPD